MIQDVHVKLCPGLPWKKEEFSNKRNHFTSKLDLNSRKKLVKYYVRNIALYGDKTWTLRKVGQKFLEIFLNVMLEKDGEDQPDRSCEK